MGKMRIFAVRHAQKERQLLWDPLPEILADQPLSQEGMYEAIALGRSLGTRTKQVDMMFAGNSQRTLQTATIVHKVMGATCLIEVVWGLYHMASDNGGVDTFYPGFEGWEMSRWQGAAVQAFDDIANSRSRWAVESPTIIVVSTSVIIAGVECHIRGIHDEAAIADAILHWPDGGRRFSVFELSEGKLEIVE